MNLPSVTVSREAEDAAQAWEGAWHHPELIPTSPPQNHSCPQETAPSREGMLEGCWGLILGG